MDTPDENFIEENYLKLLNLMYEVIQSLEGYKPTDIRQIDCQSLAFKLFFHCSSLYHLSQGTRTPIPQPSGSNFTDFATGMVLVRSIFETYLTMFEIFFEPTTEDIREFRHAHWLLSGHQMRVTHAPPGPEYAKDIQNEQQNVIIQQNRIAKTQEFNKLTPKQQKEIMKGRRSRPPEVWERIAENARFDNATIRRLYSYQSDYTHSGSVSAIQIHDAVSSSEQRDYMVQILGYAMMVISHMIINYQLFPPAIDAVLDDPSTLQLAQQWSKLTKI